MTNSPARQVHKPWNSVTIRAWYVNRIASLLLTTSTGCRTARVTLYANRVMEVCQYIRWFVHLVLSFLAPLFVCFFLCFYSLFVLFCFFSPYRVRSLCFSFALTLFVSGCVSIIVLFFLGLLASFIIPVPFSSLFPLLLPYFFLLSVCLSVRVYVC